MPNHETIGNIFGAYVNQDTLENAAIWMASVAKSDDDYRVEVLQTLHDAESRGLDGDDTIVAAVNNSGYQVADAAEAVQLIGELRRLLHAALAGCET